MTYPVVDQRSLREAPRRGPWGMGRPRRDPDELPQARGHETLVYKYGGCYLVDDGLSRIDDDHVAQATNISVVDMRAEAPVTVRTTIPAAGGGEFSVEVTFLCTVRKPEEVVEAGIRDMSEPLSHYLTRHQRLFHLGEDSEFEDVGLVRRDVTAEVKAYVKMRPPRFRGIDVTLGSVQVLTPEELAKFGHTRRVKRHESILASEDQRWEHRLATERQEHEQQRQIGQHRYEQDIEKDAERHRQDLAEFRREMDEMHALNQRRHEQLVEQMQQNIRRDRQRFTQAEEYDRDQHERRLDSERRDHALDEATKIKHAIGATDEDVPVLIAQAFGEVTAAQTADSLTTERRRTRDEEAAERARTRDEEAAERAHQREDEAAERARGREDKRQQETWRREDDAQQRTDERADRRLQLEVRLQVLRHAMETMQTGIQRGLADNQTIEDLRHLIDGVLGELNEPANRIVERADRAELAGNAAPGEAFDGPEGPKVPVTAAVISDSETDTAGEPPADTARDAGWEPDSGPEEYVMREEDIGG